ncbi:hypothetical protein ACX3V1_14350, partial [Escherichia coli]
MKRVSQMTALAMALGLACASSWAAELAKPLTLDQLQQPVSYTHLRAHETSQDLV